MGLRIASHDKKMEAALQCHDKKMEAARQFNDEVFNFQPFKFSNYKPFQFHSSCAAPIGGQPLQVAHYKAGIGEGGFEEGERRVEEGDVAEHPQGLTVCI